MNMQRSALFLSAALATAFVPACGSSGDGSGSGKAVSGPPASLDLPKLGLKIDAPKGSSVGDAIMGEGHMVTGPAGPITIELASDSSNKTAAEAKEDADMFSPKDLQAEELADGWVVTFNNTGSMGANYFVKVRREIGGKAYMCETTVQNASQSNAAVAACKSLKQ